MKKTLAIVFAGATILSMTACSTNETKTTSVIAPTETTTVVDTAADTTAVGTTAAVDDETVYKIGVFQLVQYAALDQSNGGFFAALDDTGIKYEANQQSAIGEQPNYQTTAEKLVSDKDDLVLTVATLAAQVVAGAATETPILLTIVTDPAESGLVSPNDGPGVDISDTSDLTPVSEQIDLMKQLIPDVKNVSILYCSVESNPVLQADMAKAACDAADFTYKDYTVSNSSEIRTVVESTISKVDAIHAPIDSMVVAGMVAVTMVATDNSIPVICSEAGTVEVGGLATCGIDYFQLGYLVGQQAIDILVSGADVAKTPTGYLPTDKRALTVNKITADVLGIDITGLEGADVVEQLREN